MAHNIYALLVGIDNYSVESIPTLKGCANDIKAIATYLQSQVTGKWTLQPPRKLINEQAKRQAIINGFQEHLTQADSEDIALFYYSGHGSQEPALSELLHLEPDGLLETLVCYDSRTPGNYDLADKELRYLLAQVAQKNPRIIVILDCCHSGSGTRNIPQGVRSAPQDARKRDLRDFIFDKDSSFTNLLSNSQAVKRKKTGIDLPEGRHILLSACRDYQEAKEYPGDHNELRGVFSYFLLKTLQNSNGRLSYRDIVRNIEALVNTKVKDQAPQLEATNPEDLNESFLGEALPERPLSFVLSYSTISQNGGWEINGGTIHGIPQPSAVNADQTTYLAIFPQASTVELKQPVAEVKVTQVLTGRSRVEVTQGIEELDEKQGYWAFVTSSPIEPLRIYLKESNLSSARNALEEAGIQQSLYIAIADNFEEADYNLLIRDGQYQIAQKNNDRPVVAPIADVRKTIKALEAIARWQDILELTSQGSKIDPNLVEMEISLIGHGNDEADFKPYEPDPLATSKDTDLRFEYVYDRGEWKPPVVKVKLTNKTDEDLYCNLLLLSEDYEVHRLGDKTHVLRVEDGARNRTREIYEDSFIIPDKFLQKGITEYKDIFKLIVSTTDFSADSLEQEGLEPPSANNTRGLNQLRGSLERLLRQIDTRNAGGFGKQYDDWITKQVAVTIVKPRDAKQLQAGKGVELVNNSLEVKAHPRLRANVTLTTVSQTTRAIGNLTVPPALRDKAGVIEPFQFTTSRGSDPGLSAVELLEVNDVDSVTKDEPLIMMVNQTLAADEYLLPYSYDGEFCLPLGYGVNQEQQIKIAIKRLPQPTTSSRSLGGSIKIFFKKLRHQKLGHSYKYPILATAEVTETDGIDVIYERDFETIKQQVASAQKIVLYIHGIIGDTESLVTSIQQAKVTINGQQRPLREAYDLVLTFDYENLHTTIEENARELKKRLEAVGLGANHGKELQIIAHSIGGLVARWMIEREGGNEIVQHLIMLGTPNAGSPWSTVQDMSFALLGIGLNQISGLVPPAKIITDLFAKSLEFIEQNDNSLDQIQPDSEFIKAIALNPDPKIPYTIIAGDRAIAQLREPKSFSQRLKHQLFKPLEPATKKVIDDWVFGKEPNDIAVSLASIKSVNQERSPQPKILPTVACDHMSYFSSEPGLTALVNALYQDSKQAIAT